MHRTENITIHSGPGMYDDHGNIIPQSDLEEQIDTLIENFKEAMRAGRACKLWFNHVFLSLEQTYHEFPDEAGGSSTTRFVTDTVDIPSQDALEKQAERDAKV